MATTRTQRPVHVIEGPITRERWGSVGFRLNDDSAASMCRLATAEILDTLGLSWVESQDGTRSRLVDDMQLIVTELVTNAQKYGGDAFPAGSFTLFHPGNWLHLNVHDKNPYQPWREISAALRTERHAPEKSLRTGGRGLRTVIKLAEGHCGRLETAGDGDKVSPGKVMRVSMLLPSVAWRHTYRCPWTGVEKRP